MSHSMRFGLSLLAAASLLAGCTKKEPPEAAPAAPAAAPASGKTRPTMLEALNALAGGRKAFVKCTDCTWDKIAGDEMIVTDILCEGSADPDHCHLPVLDADPKRLVKISAGSAADKYTFYLWTPSNGPEIMNCVDLDVFKDDPQWLVGTCEIHDPAGKPHHYFAARVDKYGPDPSKKEVTFWYQDEEFDSVDGNEVHNGEGHTHKPD